MKKITLFKVFTPFVCAAIVLMACPLATKEQSLKNTEETTLQQETTLNSKISIIKNSIEATIKETEQSSKETMLETTTEKIKETTSLYETTEAETIIEETTTKVEETAALRELISIKAFATSKPIGYTLSAGDIFVYGVYNDGTEEQLINWGSNDILEPLMKEENHITIYYNNFSYDLIVNTYPEETIPIQTTTTAYTEPALKGAYPVAEYVWCNLRAAGLSPAAAAGIIGNMMAECGGWTLDLHWNSYNSSQRCYGLCQWMLIYSSPEMPDSGLEYQVAYLIASLPDLLPKAYAGTEKHGFDYYSFINLSDPGYAAEIFCKEYEQCGNYGEECPRRAQFAWVAYNYFMN